MASLTVSDFRAVFSFRGCCSCFRGWCRCFSIILVPGVAAGKGRISKINCRVLLWAEKLGAYLWTGLLSWSCQLELEVTITDVVNLWQSSSVSDCII
jgi:hypothetical protein